MSLKEYLKVISKAPIINDEVFVRAVLVHNNDGTTSSRILCSKVEGRRSLFISNDSDDPEPGTYFCMTKTDLLRFEQILTEESKRFGVQFLLDDVLNKQDDVDFEGIKIRRFYTVHELNSPLVK